MKRLGRWTKPPTDSAVRLRLARVGQAVTWLGVVLILLSLGQYGWMEVQQTRLRHDWQAAHRNADGISDAMASDPDWNLIRLQIPTIQLDDIVVKGTSYGDLLVGPGWMKGTPAPGDDGNSVIAGHRDTFFRKVSKLTPGDTILVRREGKLYTFRVTRRSIVWPDQTSLLGGTHSPALTLVTCYPTYWVGPAPKRLILRARLEAVRNAME